MGYFRYVYIVLAAMITLVGSVIIENTDRHVGFSRLPHRLEITRKQMDAMAGYLRDYSKEHGHYPSNDEGLPAVQNLVQACRAHEHDYESDLFLCRLGSSGILSRWGDPFIYENRKGIDDAKFEDSGATLDRHREYSVRVDDGVYIWSLGARRAYGEFCYWRPRMYGAIGMVAAIVLGLVALFARSSVISHCRKTGIRERWCDGIMPALGGLLLSLVLPFFASPMFMATCYVMSAVSNRDEKLTREYKAVLAKYHQRGVISDSAHSKMLRALDTDRGFR